MLRALLLAIGCSVIFAAPNKKCAVKPWGEWSQCKPGLCPISNRGSRHMTDGEKAPMKGRSVMAELMRLKSDARQRKVDCLAQGTCPEFLAKRSEGFAACENGFAGQWPCQNMDLLAFIDFSDLGFDDNAVEGSDMWVWDDQDFGEYYGLMGTTHGTSFVRITNPLEPEVLGVLRTHTTPSFWRDMKVVNNHAYIVSEAADHGMQVFDLTRLRDMSPSSPVPELEVDTHYGLVGNTHNIASNAALQKLYLIGSTRQSQPEYELCDGGLHMVDVSDPKNPTFESCIGFDGYVHDTECIIYDGPDANYLGKEVCFGYNEDSLTVYDVETESQISRMTYEGYAYTHQGWITDDRKWLLLDDEADETQGDSYTKTYVWNMEDLSNPVLTWTYRSSETAIDHNLYIKGNHAYQTNYEAGMRVLDINSVTGELTEVAYFDVLPSRTEPDFYGSWSNYPWLEDNTAAISSIDYGFFLVRFNQPAVNQEPQIGEMHRYRETVYGTDFAACPALVDRKSCVPAEC